MATSRTKKQNRFIAAAQSEAATSEVVVNLVPSTPPRQSFSEPKPRTLPQGFAQPVVNYAEVSSASERLVERMERQPVEQLEKKVELERRRRISSLVEREVNAGASCRANVHFRRIHAVERLHFSDTHTRALLPLSDGTVLPVYHSNLTDIEQLVLDEHQQRLRGKLDGEPGAVHELPTIELCEGASDEALDSAMRAMQCSSGVTDTLRLDRALDRSPIMHPELDLPEAELGMPKGDGEPDSATPGCLCVLYCESISSLVAVDIIARRLSLAPAQVHALSVPIPFRTVGATLVFVQHADPGALLSFNTYRLEAGVVRISNVHRTTYGAFRQIDARWSQGPGFERTAAIRRCSDAGKLVSEALTAAMKTGTLNYRSLHSQSLNRDVKTMSALLQHRSTRALRTYLDVPTAPKAVVDFLSRFSRDSAQAYSKAAKEQNAMHDAFSQCIRVFAASGSALAAMLALPKATKKRLLDAPSIFAFNAMLSRRYKRHGKKVVVGDLVAVGPGTREAGRVVYGPDDVKRVESAEEAAKYTIMDVVMPMLRVGATSWEHVPSCAGLERGEITSMLATLGVPFLVPDAPLDLQPWFHNEFEPLYRGGQRFFPVWVRPEGDFEVVEHPVPIKQQIFDAKLLLPHDRALRAAGVDLAHNSAAASKCDVNDQAGAHRVDTYPMRAVREAQAAGPADLTAMYSALEGFADGQFSEMPMCRMRAETASVLAADAVWLDEPTPEFGRGDFLDSSGLEVEFVEPLSHDALSTATVTSAVVTVRGEGWDAILREVFSVSGPVDQAEVSLQVTVHNAVTRNDTEIDFALADRRCKTCFSLQHVASHCPFGDLLERRHADSIAAAKAKADAMLLSRGATIVLERDSPSESWGLSLLPSGELVGVTAESPAHRGVQLALPGCIPNAARMEKDRYPAIAATPETKLVGDAAAAAVGNKPSGTAALARFTKDPPAPVEFEKGELVRLFEKRGGSSRRFIVAVNGQRVRDGNEVRSIVAGLKDATRLELVVAERKRLLKKGDEAPSQRGSR